MASFRWTSRVKQDDIVDAFVDNFEFCGLRIAQQFSTVETVVAVFPPSHAFFYWIRLTVVATWRNYDKRYLEIIVRSDKIDSFEGVRCREVAQKLKKLLPPLAVSH